jgi:N-acetylglucosamine-6-phosphate deacetylase
MRSTMQIDGHVLTPDGFVRGRVILEGARVGAVEGSPCREEDTRGDAARPLVLPGFVDLHVHGGGGADTMDAGNAVRDLARTHARYGTTALLATTMTAPLPEIESALLALAAQCRERIPGAARVLGVHLEGPYLSAERLGAQPAFTRAPSLPEILRLHALAPIKVLTLAPEVDGALALIAPLVEAGIRVQIGHTQASYEQAVEALQCGAAGFTHLFNAMSAMHHRVPGAVGAALAHARRTELIVDLQHVHPGAIRAALRAVPDLYAVTDATSATDMPDGDYRLGRQTVTKCLDAVRLADGTLAGSTLTMDRALRNLVDLGLSLAEASLRTSTLAARYVGENERGAIVPGHWADLVVLDPATLMPQRVVVEGEMIDAARY